MPALLRALLFTIALTATAPAFAVPCAPGTLTDYFALGNGGCEAGDLLFAGFQPVELPSAASPIATDTIDVTPNAGSNGLAFTLASPLSADAGVLLQILFGFQVSMLNGPQMTGAQLAFTGTGSVTGDGTITGVEDLCLGGNFASPPTGCDGTPLSLIVFDVGIDGDADESIAFAPINATAVVLDLALDGGLDGNAQAQGGFGLTVAFDTQQVPEPSILALLTAALLALPIVHPRARRRRDR